MGIFYREGRYRNFRKFLTKHGFAIREGGGHLIAAHPDDESISIALPRHKILSKGVTENICKKLLELGYPENEVKKIF